MAPEPGLKSQYQNRFFARRLSNFVHWLAKESKLFIQLLAHKVKGNGEILNYI